MHRVISDRQALVRCAMLISGVLLFVPTTNAHAQLGKLKKLGADAIKDKAKEKIAGKETPEATKDANKDASKSEGTAKESSAITVAQLDQMLAALVPMAAEAEKATQLRKVATEHARKDSIANKCLEAGQQALMASRTPPKVTPAQQARAKQFEKDGDRLGEVAIKAFEKDDKRAGAFAQDSMGTAQRQSAALVLGLKCTFEYTPPALMETRVATFGMSGDLPVPASDVPASARTSFSRVQFATLRERIALFAISSQDPTAKLGKEGVFTDEERAALTARSADIQKLLPYFKNGTLRWKTYNDLSGW